MKPATPTKLDMSPANRAACSNANVTLRAAGGAAPLSQAASDEMLARAMSGQRVELELDVMAFEQRPGVSNRNFVRFRDGAMLAMARTGVGTPFLRDHDQGDALARGGTVIASQAEKRGDGDYAIRQTVKLTAPWAVELALRGLLDTVSIGWNPTGATLCSVCSSNFWRCSHSLGQRYVAREEEGGARSYIADANGPLVCERLYTAADLVETSAVNVPAVPAAHIEAIRAALSAHNHGGDEPHGDNMNPKLLALLGLAATAGEPEIISAVESRQERLRLTELARDEAVRLNAELAAKCTGFEQVLSKQAVDAFIADGVRCGKIIPASGYEQSLRNFFGKDAEGARELLKSSPVVTPVGQPLQSGGAAPIVDPTVASAMADVEAKIVAQGGTLAGARASLIKCGKTAAEADKMLIATYGSKKAA